MIWDTFIRLFSINEKVLESGDTLKLAELQKAISLGARIKIKYFSRVDSSFTEREVIPQEILRQGRNTYLVGHCCLRNDRRSFRVDGIVHLELL